MTPPNPASRDTADCESTADRLVTRSAVSKRIRTEFPPSPKSVRTWAVPVAAGVDDELVAAEGELVSHANKPTCKSQFEMIVIGVVFLAILAGWSTWLLLRAVLN